jgi:hypothetical protein
MRLVYQNEQLPGGPQADRAGSLDRAFIPETYATSLFPPNPPRRAYIVQSWQARGEPGCPAGCISKKRAKPADMPLVTCRQRIASRSVVILGFAECSFK